MSQLSAQSIMALCAPGDRTPNHDSRMSYRCRTPDGAQLPMISPFVAEKTVRNGLSYGLSATSYDLRIAHNLILGPHPGHVLRTHLREAGRGLAQAILPGVWSDLRPYEKGGVHECFQLATTVETLALPWNVSGRLCDKSTRARQGISCFNTLFDPGFIGVATLELVNLSPDPIVIQEGDPICQIIFTWLDEATDRPYDGKYQNQGKQPVGPILEGAVAA